MIYSKDRYGKFDKTQFKAEDFTIKKFGTEFFICVEHQRKTPYLRRNGEVHDTCGSANFFVSIEQAQETLDRYFNPIILPEHLFEINI